MALRIAQQEKYVGDDYWDWKVWLDGTNKELNQIKEVTYTLHPTFPNPVRTIDSRKNKFCLKTAGWGTFRLYAKVVLKDGKTEKLKHDLQLRYPNGKLTDA